MEKVRYMISDAANLINVESHVLRYWEDELNLEIPRNEMGHRYYTEDNIQQFLTIKGWKEQGYQLKAIRMLVQEERMKAMTGTKRAVQMEASDPQGGQAIPEGNVDKNANTQLVAKEGVQPERMTDPSAQNTVKLEQFRSMMTDIVRGAMEENNQSLGNEIGYQVGDKVIKEMNYLMRVQEEAEEERFRKLDAAIRSQRKGRKSKEDKEQKTGRLFKKDKKLNPNLSI